MTTEATSQGEAQTDETGANTAAATEGTAAETGSAAAGAEGASADAGTSTAPIRPEGLEDKYWDATSGVKVGDLVSDLREMQARAADVPAEGEAYDLALPADVKVPEGLKVEFKAEDPLWAEFQTIARESGLGREGFGKFVGAFAKYQIAQSEADIATYQAEKTALGANADNRINAADAWLKANMKSEHAAALADVTVTKAGVEAIEALIRMKSGPAAATPGGAAANTNKFEGLHGESMLHAARASKAA